MTTATPDPVRTARVLHVALVAGCVLIAGTFSALWSVGVFGAAGLPAAVQWAAVPAVPVVIVLRMAFVRQLPPVEGDAAAWWTANLPRVVIVWALEEGWFLIGTMLWAVTGGPAWLGLAGVAFALLAWDRPGRVGPTG